MTKRLSLVLVLAFATLMVANAKRNVATIIPAPMTQTQGSGKFVIVPETKLHLASTGIDTQIIETAIAEAKLPIVIATEPSKKGITASLVKEIKGVSSAEGYRLVVTSKGINIEALTDAGIYYAIQSLAQLSHDGVITSTTIVDEPRFEYRGIMLDVSRHFRDKAFVKKQIDLMSQYKLNRLHLHLTDAAGWRIEIKKYPRLTELAAWRPFETWKEWSENGNRYCDYTDPNARGGFFTQNDIREIVEYARLHCITIIPEIEMPSHSEEVLTAYPELSCSHQPYKNSDFCVGNEKTFEFIENVLTEVMQLFPSKYIHIGGDEAGKQAWKTCPLCQERMQKENLKDVDELQSYLIHRVEKFLNKNGRDLLGWDEILEGGLAPNATVMSWRGTEGGIKAAQMGHKAIMTPGEFCYFDSNQDAPHTMPLAIGGYLPLKKVYGYDPANESEMGAAASNIIGVQANLWTEHVPTAQLAEFMLYPRALAIAELGWTKASNKDWNSFAQRVKVATPKLIANGYNAFDFTKEVGNRPGYETPLKHLAMGKKVTFREPWWRAYPANKEATLTDGNVGGWAYNDRRWLGFVGKNRMDVVIDLEKETTIHSVKADFMQVCGPDVWFPEKVIISVSADGENFTTLTEINHEVVRDDVVSFKTFGWQGEAKCRYVRYQAKASKFGGVQFVDEIIVE